MLLEIEDIFDPATSGETVSIMFWATLGPAVDKRKQLLV